MGVDYSSYLVIGWHIDCPDLEDSDGHVEDYLDPLCKKHGLQWVTSGSAYSGREDSWLTLNHGGVGAEEIARLLARRTSVEAALRADGAKIGEFVIDAVGHVW